MQAERALIGSQLMPLLFLVFDFYLHYIRSYRSKTLLYYDSFDSFVTYLHLPCYPVFTYLVTALLLTLLPCLHLLCYPVSTYFVTMSFIIMSFAFCQQYYYSNYWCPVKLSSPIRCIKNAYKSIIWGVFL